MNACVSRASKAYNENDSTAQHQMRLANLFCTIAGKRVSGHLRDIKSSWTNQMDKVEMKKILFTFLFHFFFFKKNFFFLPIIF